MDFRTGIIIIGEFAVLGTVVFCFVRERALLAWENRTVGTLKRLLRRMGSAHEYRRREKLNRKALYTPVKPPKTDAGEKAA